MPVAMQRKKILIGLLGNAVNSAFNYPNYFSMIPTGPDPKPSFTKGFFDVAVRQNPKPQTVAIVAADAEFGIQAAEGARENAKAALEVESSPGRGMRVTIVFTRADSAPEAVDQSSAPGSQGALGNRAASQPLG